ncbi:hypothetical protein MNBD_GAMMA03-8 [hydrothermal vent metagenome]|uniref:Conserved hypothetical protein CHP03032 domain-containing protein n=1 Tax=hydrothermal vent metagenome TaxID=652676 RepID=A0A3B0WDE5_9ZZZZ
MNDKPLNFLVSFCNNKKNIKKSSGIGILGLINFDGRGLKYKELELDLQGCQGVNGATGIGKCDKYYYVVLQANISKLLILDHSFSTVSICELDNLKGVHSLCYLNGDLYIVVTKQDKVVKYDFRGNFETVFDLKTDLDTLHLNSICFHKGSLLVSGFGKNDKDFWMYANNGYVFDVATNKVIMSGLRQPHSLFSYKDDIFLCDSSRKNIINSKKQIIICNEKGYTRGLFIKDGFIIFGISKGRETSISKAKYIGNISDEGILAGECSINVRTKSKNYSFSLKGFSDEIYDILQIKK